ncbi:hypothetical protein BDV95DRAFT_590513 [Massariosphaeria phaeospora]|uniref:Uncharacterized protein n=1 Tax=Massariosphaeria phaeospora TaxID=100035 RepID=A0A7C8IN18_9PLEO|nr:hypothetical protein BDV95DRAFT_590513 [Massariosphaeria phaeospora]
MIRTSSRQSLTLCTIKDQILSKRRSSTDGALDHNRVASAIVNASPERCDNNETPGTPASPSVNNLRNKMKAEKRQDKKRKRKILRATLGKVKATKSNHENINPTTSPSQTLELKTSEPPQSPLSVLLSSVSITHPVAKDALAFFATLHSRIVDLHAYIRDLETKRKDEHIKLKRLPPYKPAPLQILRDLQCLEEFIALATRHFTDVFMLEQALIDVLEQQSGSGEGKIRMELEKGRTELEDLERGYQAEVIDWTEGP